MSQEAIITAANATVKTIFTPVVCARIGGELCSLLSNATYSELLSMAHHVNQSWAEMIRFFIMLALGLGMFIIGDRHLRSAADLLFMTIFMIAWVFINIYMDTNKK